MQGSIAKRKLTIQAAAVTISLSPWVPELPAQTLPGCPAPYILLPFPGQGWTNPTSLVISVCQLRSQQFGHICIRFKNKHLSHQGVFFHTSFPAQAEWNICFYKQVLCCSHQFPARLWFKMLILRRKTGGKNSCNLVQHVGAETVLGSWVVCSVTEKILQLLISLLFASDSASEAINPERQQKELGRQVWKWMPKGRAGKKGINSRVDGVTRSTWEDQKNRSSEILGDTEVSSLSGFMYCHQDGDSVPFGSDD